MFSLSGAYIRAALVRACTSLGRRGSQVPQTIVYSYPTIQQLSNWLWKELTGTNEHMGMEVDVKATVATMKDLTRKHLQILADGVRASRQTGVDGTNGTVHQDEKRAVLVTGTTGALGAHLLETLLLDSTVDEVFALNRHPRSAKAEQIVLRQKAVFDKRGISRELLESPKLTFVDADRIEDIEPDVISRVCSWRLFPHVCATVLR
jgi:Male sterility protein